MEHQEPSSRARDALSGVVFISVPDALHDKLVELKLDAARLLPVETGADAGKWNIAELTWEMILSGMLKILAWQPDHEDAGYYRSFIKHIKPELVRELTDAGIVKARNRDFDLAEEIFRALVGIEPDNSRFLLNLAMLYEDRSRNHAQLGHAEEQEESERQAAAWYRNTLSLDDVVPEAYLYAGHFWLRQHDAVQARGCFTEYLRTGDDPEQKAAVTKLVDDIDRQDLQDNLFKEAYDFIRMEREAEAVERITEFLAARPGVWNAWFLLGWAYRRLGRWGEGRDAFLKACELGGDTSDTLNELAICQMELGAWTDSRKALEKALRLEPDNVKIISNLGILSLKQDKREEAAAFFRTALEFEPDDPIARNYLDHLEED